MVLEITVAETNRIRISLGLKPIPTNDDRSISLTSQESKDAQSSSVTQNEAVRDRVAKLATESQYRKAVSGKTLADAPQESASSWLSRLRAQKAQNQVEPVADSATKERIKALAPRKPSNGLIGESSGTANQHDETEVLVFADSDVFEDDSELVNQNHQPVTAAPPSSQRSRAKTSTTDLLDDPLEAEHEQAEPVQVIDDFTAPREVKFRKRKRAAKSGRTLLPEELESSAPPSKAIRNDESEVLVALSDDIDLSIPGRSKHSRQATPPLRQIAPETSPLKSGDLVVNETRSFLASLKRNGERNSERKGENLQTPVFIDGNSQESPENTAATATQVPIENSVEPALAVEVKNPQDEEQQVPEHQGGFSSLTDTLKLLQNKSIIGSKPATQSRGPQSNGPSRDWARKIVADRIARQHELDEEEEALRRLPLKEQELRRAERDQQAARQEVRIAREEFKEYRPDVALVHRDSSGKEMTPTEAFKDLSRRFHGTSEGNKRAHRRAKRAAEVRGNLEAPIFKNSR